MTILHSQPICTPRVTTPAADVQGCRAKGCNDVNAQSQLDTQALTNCVSQYKDERWADFALLSLGNFCSLTSVSPLLQGEAKYLHSITPTARQHQPALTPLLFSVHLTKWGASSTNCELLLWSGVPPSVTLLASSSCVQPFISMMSNSVVGLRFGAFHARKTDNNSCLVT